MFYEKKPPAQGSENEFPSIDSVVTVANCWYYLSLLERFVNVTKPMPESVLKVYLVRAEYRYFKWMFKNQTEKRGSKAIPPIDVAFFWQAHMLSPARFYEDSLRMKPYRSDRICLKEIHEARQSPDKDILVEWKKVMDDEPYELTSEELLNSDSCATVTCIVCYSRIESPWEEYSEWRTDHKVALQCSICHSMFTVKHVGKANLIADNSRKSTNMTSGLILDENRRQVNSTYSHSFLKEVNEIKALPFNQGSKSCEDYLNGKPELPEFLGTRKKVLDAIKSTYLCTPYRGSSIDLIQAVARQYKFAVKVTKDINWDVPQGIITGIRHYSSFLAIIKENTELTAVPTFEIDLAWHTHMLHPDNYRIFCYKYIGNLINHDDNIPEEELQQYVQKTSLAWDARQEKRDSSYASIIESKSDYSHKFGFKTRFLSIMFEISNDGESSGNFKNGFVPEKKYFKGRYIPGTYKSSPAYTPSLSTPEKDSTEKASKILTYDETKISFHDKRYIKEFITLKNSDKLMDKEFADVKKSAYGFIGTSTCGNTDYLDQWDISKQNDDDDDDVTVCSSSLPQYGDNLTAASKYTKVFLTRTDSKSLDILKNEDRQNLALLNGQNNRYNMVGETFNWYLVSLSWTQFSNLNHHSVSCGGWGSCTNTSDVATSGDGIFSCGGGGGGSC